MELTAAPFDNPSHRRTTYPNLIFILLAAFKESILELTANLSIGPIVRR